MTDLKGSRAKTGGQGVRGGAGAGNDARDPGRLQEVHPARFSVVNCNMIGCAGLRWHHRRVLENGDQQEARHDRPLLVVVLPHGPGREQQGRGAQEGGQEYEAVADVVVLLFDQVSSDRGQLLDQLR